MGCGCKENSVDVSSFTPISDEYVRLHDRLLEYGKEVYGEHLMEKFTTTRIWLFTFYCEETMSNCPKCIDMLADIGRWMSKYGFIDDPINNIKWVIDDEPEKNLILKDLHIEKTPVNIFTDGKGKIIDILYGFPDFRWLEKYILPLVSKKF